MLRNRRRVQSRLAVAILRPPLKPYRFRLRTGRYLRAHGLQPSYKAMDSLESPRPSQCISTNVSCSHSHRLLFRAVGIDDDFHLNATLTFAVPLGFGHPVPAFLGGPQQQGSGSARFAA